MIIAQAFFEILLGYLEKKQTKNNNIKSLAMTYMKQVSHWDNSDKINILTNRH